MFIKESVKENNAVGNVLTIIPKLNTIITFNYNEINSKEARYKLSKRLQLKHIYVR